MVSLDSIKISIAHILTFAIKLQDEFDKSYNVKYSKIK